MTRGLEVGPACSARLQSAIRDRLRVHDVLRTRLPQPYGMIYLIPEQRLSSRHTTAIDVLPATMPLHLTGSLNAPSPPVRTSMHQCITPHTSPPSFKEANPTPVGTCAEHHTPRIGTACAGHRAAHNRTIGTGLHSARVRTPYHKPKTRSGVHSTSSRAQAHEFAPIPAAALVVHHARAHALAPYLRRAHACPCAGSHADRRAACALVFCVYCGGVGHAAAQRVCLTASTSGYAQIQCAGHTAYWVCIRVRKCIGNVLRRPRSGCRQTGAADLCTAAGLLGA